MIMKRKSQILFLCCFLVANFLDAQTSSLKGRVSIINSKNSEGEIEYVKDVLITTPYSKEVKSDFKGRFFIELNGHNSKEAIGLQAIKEGYEVVNKADLESALSDKKYTFRIFLAEEGFLENRQNRLSDVANKFISTHKDEVLDSIAFGGANSKLAIKNLAQSSGKKVYDAFEAEELLLQMNKFLIKQLPNHTSALAVVNSDYASKQYRIAFKLYEKGKLYDVINTINEKNLDNGVKYVKKVLDDVIDDPDKSYKLISIRMNTLDQIKNSYALKIIALQQTFQFLKAEATLKKLIKITKIAPTVQDYVLLEKLKIGDFQAEEVEYVNSVLEKKKADEILTSGKTETTSSGDFKNEKINIASNEKVNITSSENILNKKNKNTSGDILMEKGEVSKEVFSEKINRIEANKNIATIQQAGDLNKDMEQVVSIETSKSLTEAELSDFENTLFIAKKPTDQLITILNREKTGGVSYPKSQPVVISQEVQPYISPSPPVQKYIEPTPVVIATPAVIDKSSYISLDEIRVMKTDNKRPAKIKTVAKARTKTVRKVITKRTSLRRSATASSKVLKRLAVGTEVKVIEKVSKYWSRVILNGKEGFVKSFLLK